MDQEELPDWTLADHLDAGRAALKAIACDSDLGTLPQPVCHHFGELVPVEEMKESREAVYAGLESAFQPLGLDFSTFSLDAWETVVPNLEWLERRLPALLSLAAECGLTYEGWTWEPRARQPVSASTVEVLNFRSEVLDKGREGE